jgi:type IV secretion system protein VirB1
MIPGIEALACGQLAVPTDVMAHVVQVESSRNPFAIGVVGGRLQRQPRNLAEAVATVEMLEERGYNYSVGLAQVNRTNFRRFGLDVPEQAFDACINLRTGARILAECLERHDGRWGDAFSCYYSGNGHTGYQHGYVQKVFASMATQGGGSPAIPLADTARTPVAAEAVRDDGQAALVDARVTAAASRFLPIIKPQQAPDAERMTESGAVPARGSPVDARLTASAPEEQFLRVARARLATTARAEPRTPAPASAIAAGSQPSAPTTTPDSQEDSNIARDPARVF